MMILALILLLFFLAVYLFLGGSVIYHLKVYTLPGWSGGKASIALFLGLSFFLIAAALFFFFSIPWEALKINLQP